MSHSITQNSVHVANRERKRCRPVYEAGEIRGTLKKQKPGKRRSQDWPSLNAPHSRFPPRKEDKIWEKTIPAPTAYPGEKTGSSRTFGPMDKISPPEHGQEGKGILSEEGRVKNSPPSQTNGEGEDKHCAKIWGHGGGNTDILSFLLDLPIGMTRGKNQRSGTLTKGTTEPLVREGGGGEGGVLKRVVGFHTPPGGKRKTNQKKSRYQGDERWGSTIKSVLNVVPL